MKKKDLINIYLIRHGEARAAWDQDPDPGLSKKGKLQSEALVKEIMPYLPSRFNIYSSPLLRARETAIPLQNSLNFNLNIKNTYAEIPSPGIPLSERKIWLRKIFKSKIKELEEPQIDWRESILDSIKLLKKDTIIFSHFMVINCIVGWIVSADKLVTFYPDNCSITKIQKEGEYFKLKNLGKEFPNIVQ